jgi:hypothetical protein
MVTSGLGQLLLTDCPIDGISSYDRSHYLPLMKALEKEFKCAGMCENPKLFLFSDVS